MSKRFTESEINFIKEYYPDYGSKFCADKLDRSIDSIQSKASRLGIARNRSVTLDGDEINFKETSLELSISQESMSKEMAYFLGFFWADGYIKPDMKGIIIEIVKDDGDDIKHIFDKICSWRIYERDREGRKKQMSFYTSSASSVSLLSALGKYSKSSESHGKILDFIPNEFKIYFIRGLIDGDGCFYYNNKSTQIYISSNYNQDWEALIEYFHSIGVNMKVSKEDSNSGKSSYIRCTDLQQIYHLFKTLYANEDGIYLTRKFNKMKEIITKRNLRG